MEKVYFSDSLDNEDWIKAVDVADDNFSKGGPGSGNFGHVGRPGRVGGSQADPGGNRQGRLSGVIVALPVSLGDYLTAAHYSDQQVSTDKLVVTHPAQLPPVAEGHTRIYHGTSMDNLQSILDNGIQLGSTIGSKEALPFIMGVEGAESAFGEANIVFDFSSENPSLQKINDSWVEIYQTITPAQIVGVYLPAHRANGAIPEQVTWLMNTFEEYKQMDPETITPYKAFVEEDHPRDEVGRFIKKNTGASELPIDLKESKRVAKMVDARNKQCYRNSALGAVSIRGEYVEGFVALELGVVIEHAWIEKERAIIEPTPAMQKDGKNVYFAGPRLSSDEILARQQETMPYFNSRNSRTYQEAYVASYRYAYGDDIADKIQQSMQVLGFKDVTDKDSQ